MKAVILGGGIAGLTMGILLRRQNWEVVINERSVGIPIRGHAFLMHDDGLRILRELDLSNQIELAGKKITSFSLRRPDGAEIKHIRLQDWQCIKRVNLIRFLYSLLPAKCIKEGRTFTRFIYDNHKIIAAVFSNGEIEYGDIFIGADGGNSKVRELIHGKVKFTPVHVKEVVGVTSNIKQKVKRTTTEFIKFQNKNNGLAFGLIPTSHNEYVWYMQYDPSISDVLHGTPEELKSFCYKLLKKFPAMVTDILDGNDFNTSYIWNTRDFDLLPSFHKHNVVLIGDAAHLALPFTSAGTTNAIVDARVVAQNLETEKSYEDAFKKYYDRRAYEVANHINLGRELKSLFLSPQDQNDDDIPVPLIPNKQEPGMDGKSKQVQVMYFTDPICSTCWIIQPLLRKLSLEYGKYINVEYHMGGLLPSWEDYTAGKIRQPSDAAKHWEEVCIAHDMPLDGDIWEEDPLPSSYPPSIAFKAAQMQDTYKAILFLRRIKEMVFVEKKNIIKWQFLQKAAFEVGLDSARLLRDFEGKARDLFKDDLRLAHEMGVRSFPTLFFRNGTPDQLAIRGYQPYENFEEVIYKLIPGAQKEKFDTDPKYLFTRFSSMTNKEFAFLTGMPKENAATILNDLHLNGKIDKYESKNGIVWISKFDS
jgi:2-polyprenyl-6-methoxyphenol hydroxylase-like FAD-dependent oxidoreductase/predicted DsbA family dithiol-disulfide isomerase